MREIRLQLASLSGPLRAFAFCHIDVCPDNLETLSVAGEQKNGQSLRDI
jgi:hypothetical protein